MEKIVLIDENNMEEEFEIIATFGLDDDNYAALKPLDEIKEDIYILRIEQDSNGDTIFLGIEDNEELKDAIIAYESLINEE